MGLFAVNPIVWLIIVGLFLAVLPRRLWVQRQMRRHPERYATKRP